MVLVSVLSVKSSGASECIPTQQQRIKRTPSSFFLAGKNPRYCENASKRLYNSRLMDKPDAITSKMKQLLFIALFVSRQPVTRSVIRFVSKSYDSNCSNSLESMHGTFLTKKQRETEIRNVHDDFSPRESLYDVQ